MTKKHLDTSLTPQKEAMDIIKHYFKKEIEGDSLARIKGQKKLKKFLIKTEDGSYTLNSNEVSGKSETMHTHHGAITESMEKFVKPSLLENKKNIKVLDICSGLGYNAAALIDYLDPLSNEDINLSLDMVEISTETVAAGLLVPSPLNSHLNIKKAYEEELIKQKFARFNMVEHKIPSNLFFNVIIEDARQAVLDLKEDYYNAIFLDPFSPSKAPELYSVEFLKILKKIIKKDGVICTYTSAAPVRAAFVEAGFHIGEGPCFGRKSGGTVASLSLENIKEDISADDERMIALSDAGIPFRDPHLNLNGSELILNRLKERKSARGNFKFSSAVKTPLFLGKDIEKDRLGRRIVRNTKQMYIDNLKSKEAFYLICFQYDYCVCVCGKPRIYNSRDRIIKMRDRLFLHSF
ncbi:MAG: hypothetical protein KKF16_03300 [Euryarchaeota archaeon]|nr:hypothetical protein [Euryarchaeota archaeon]MBU4608126.1 hypothetical protein [Euryarchaeota archaeon]MBV1728964.1 hypothetical protein [Methanobacterium sp.]MBV1755623.1 hypothetical protein [Methanobacterium sp.]MBV1767978.1 hypothetical protein [Methanobacterium sp.]